MVRTAAEHTIPGGTASEAWHSYVYATGAYISDCTHVVVALWWRSLRRWLRRVGA